MSSTPNKVTVVLLFFFALGLLLGGSLLYRPQINLLTKTEKQFVGYWLHVEHQEEEPGAGITLKSDRAFQSNSRQFFGTWAVVSGKLQINYRGVRNWGGNSWPEKLLNGMQSQPLNRHQFDVAFSEEGRRLQLTALGDSTVSKLIRAAE
jgi:hypothetical protein